MALAQRVARGKNPWCGGTVARFGLLAEAQRRGVRAVVLGMAGDEGSDALVVDLARRHDLGLVGVGSVVVTPPG